MSVRGESIEEATALLASGNEAKALQVLHDAALPRPTTPSCCGRSTSSQQAHESSRGFHKIEWHRLMIETEPQTTSPSST